MGSTCVGLARFGTASRSARKAASAWSRAKTAVLRAFGERSGVQDVASFVTVMIQSQTFGTSIAESLRVYAGEMRDKRVMRAEEAANKIPTKMTLGTMMFTVPPLLIILVGPSVYDMVQTFANMGIG